MNNIQSPDQTEAVKGKAVIVLGMPCTGTSLVMRICNLLGVGRVTGHGWSQRLSPVNRLGEHTDILRADNELLESIGSSYYYFGEIHLDAIANQIIRRYRGKISHILQRDYINNNLWAVNNPLLCRLIPLWQPIFQELACDPVFVIMGRHPVEVSNLLYKRESIHTSMSDLLWLRYLIESEMYTRGYQRVFVTHNSILRNWRNEMLRISKALNFQWPKPIYLAGQDIDRFVKYSLESREIDSTSQNDVKYSPWLREAYSAFQVAENGNITELMTVLNRISTELKHASDIFEPWINRLESESNRTQPGHRSIKYEPQINSIDPSRPAWATRETYENVVRKNNKFPKMTIGLGQTGFKNGKPEQNMSKFESGSRKKIADKLKKIQIKIGRKSFNIIRRFGYKFKLDKLVQKLNEPPREDYFLFDPDYYLDRYPDIASLFSHDPLLHFQTHGAREFRSPHPLFDPHYYLARNGDIIESDRKNLLQHYIQHGAEEKRDPHPLFDTIFYLDKNPDISPEDRKNPLKHYLDHGAAEGRNPHPLFITSYYVNLYPEVEESNMNPLIHFVLKGAFERKTPSPFFNPDFYLKNNPDARISKLDPLCHYILVGSWRGSMPCPMGQPKEFLDRIGHGSCR